MEGGEQEIQCPRQHLSSTLSTVHSTMPSSDLSTVHSMMPSSDLSTVHSTMPSSDLSTVHSTMPSSDLSTVHSTMPSSDLSTVHSTMPSSNLFPEDGSNIRIRNFDIHTWDYTVSKYRRPNAKVLFFSRIVSLVKQWM